MYTLEGSSDTSAGEWIVGESDCLVDGRFLDAEDEGEAGDGEDNVTAMGHLSLDENREVIRCAMFAKVAG
jgi:hypothetical protein